jgi:hypothetical protein
MLVTFTYQSDDLNDELEESPTRPTPASQRRGGGNAQEEGDEGGDEGDSGVQNQKIFTFWTKLTFGEVVPLSALQPPPSTIAPTSTSTSAHPPSLAKSSEPKNR